MADDALAPCITSSSAALVLTRNWVSYQTAFASASSLGVVSLRFRELSKIISWKYTMPETTFMLRISSWNFARVPKAWLWHTYKVSAWNYHKKYDFCKYTNFERISGRACEMLVKQPTGNLPCSQGPVSISEKTSYRKILQSLEAARFVFRIVRSLWNLTGTLAALLLMCLSNFKAIRRFKVPISRLRDFTSSYDKTSFQILRRGQGLCNSSEDQAHLISSLSVRSSNEL